MTAPARAYRDLTESEIADALSYCNSDDRAVWVRMAFAIKHELGEAGFQIWDSWSRGSNSYNEKDAKHTWKSARESGARGSVTIGTLIAEAQTHGYRLNEQERTPLSADEIARRAQDRAEREAAAKLKLEQDRANAATRATEIWEAAEEIDDDGHAYLARKQVLAFGLRIGTYRGVKDALLVPMRTIDGALVSLQAIFENSSPMMDGRDRDYLPLGQKWGAFHMIGEKPSGSAPVIVVDEGYATGASIHMATGFPVAVAFDAGNLRNVALAARNTYPRAIILIAADDDRWHEGKPNEGVRQAQQAAQIAGAQVVIPHFANSDSKPTDFNDLHLLQGLEAVRTQIRAAIPHAANDNGPAVPLDSPINSFEFPHLSTKMAPLNTVENLGYLFDQYGISARYNEMRKQVELSLPGRAYSNDNKANCSLAELTSICVRNRMPQSMLQDYVKLIADQNAYNPVRDWINSRPWDGVTRLQALYNTVRVAPADEPMRDMLIYRWMISCVAAVFQPFGFESHGVLVFAGPQGQGKTKWIKRLVPHELNAVLTGAVLDPNARDTITNAVAHWLVELGELDATFRKSDIARLKAFITNAIDKMRRPYDRVESEYQRRTVFFASVNGYKFLVDESGNRRWWTILCTGVDYLHSIDMQQVWAELLELFQQGERWHLVPEEMERLNEHNTEFEAVDPIQERILSTFDWHNKTLFAGKRMTATEVCIAIGIDNPNSPQVNKASKVLQELTGGMAKRSGKGRFFDMPKRIRGGSTDDDAPGTDDRPY